MRNLLTVSLLLFALTAYSQSVSMQRIQEEENPVYKEVVDNSEYAKLWRQLCEAKKSGNGQLYASILQELRTNYPDRMHTIPPQQNNILNACGPLVEPPFVSDWGNFNTRVSASSVYSGGTNTSMGENPKTLRLRSDSLGSLYCAFIKSTRDSLILCKSSNSGQNWIVIQRFSATAPAVFHSFDFYATDSANVTKLGFAVSIVSSAVTTDGQLYFALCNGDGSNVRISQIQATPGGRGLINPAIMSDGSQHPGDMTYWYVTYSSYSPSTPTANDALAAITPNWGTSWTYAVARNTFNDYDLDIDYVTYPTGDSVYVILANNLTLTNANLRVRKISLAAFGTGAWSQVNPAGSAAPEYGSQLSVNRATGQIVCTFTSVQSGIETIGYNYTTPGGASFNTTSYGFIANQPNATVFPMLSINPYDNIFRVAYLGKGGTRDTIKYASSTDPSAGFTRFAGNINYQSTGPSIDVAPDVTGVKTISSVGGIVFTTVGNAGSYYHGENFPLVGISNNNGTPDGFSLSQNYPNPFNPSTNIKYNIPVSGFVTLKVYNILGNEVANLVNTNQTAGEYSIDFNTSSLNLSSGVYFYKLTAGEFTDVKKMSLIK